MSSDPANSSERNRHPTKGLGVWVLAGAGLLVVLGWLRPVTTDRPIPYRTGAARATAQSLTAAFAAYRSDYGIEPTGSYSEIVTALRGNNPRKIVYFEAARKAFTASGELVDPWGSPYVVNRSDPGNPRFYSIGPNKVDDGDVPGSDDTDPGR